MSRSDHDLHPVVKERWNKTRAKYATTYPDFPQPFLTTTFRPDKEQNELFAIGRTKPGNIVTNAKAGESLHNYFPSCAFDIAFAKNGIVEWNPMYFEKFAAIAKENGLEWGGDWKTFKDNPHYQAKGYTLLDAKAGKDPE